MQKRTFLNFELVKMLTCETVMMTIFCKQLQAEHPAFIFGTNGLELRSVRSTLRPLLYSLRNRYQFMVIDITVVDCLSNDGRFIIKYLLFSRKLNTRLTVTIYATETIEVPSVKDLFPAAG